jgi:hypothetical protein
MRETKENNLTPLSKIAALNRRRKMSKFGTKCFPELVIKMKI